VADQACFLGNFCGSLGFRAEPFCRGKGLTAELLRHRRIKLLEKEPLGVSRSGIEPYLDCQMDGRIKVLSALMVAGFLREPD
jgi:hypothetical protein